MAADDSLLGARPSEGAVLSLHKVDPQSLWCVGDEAPQVGQLIGLVHVSNACQIQTPHQLPACSSKEEFTLILILVPLISIEQSRLDGTEPS